ncbi:MAG: NAD(P)/FAD-dependent oxidoreductase [Desulfonatronovibrio sp.]
MKKYQVIVIGAGPAGGACASACIKNGLKVAMVEDYGFGGTCPLRGCNPKKILTGAAEIVALAEGLNEKGIISLPKISWQKLSAFRDSFVQGKKDKIKSAYSDLGIDTYLEHAEFIDKNVIKAGSHHLESDYFVLATGIKPAPLNIPGAELISSSDDFLALTKLPESICFIGGGFISFEFASIAVRAGAKVSIVHRSQRVLKQFDSDLTRKLVLALQDAGVEVHLNTPLQSVSKEGNTCLVMAGEKDDPLTIKADMVVHGAGRVPNVDSLNLDKPGVKFNRQGIEVNKFMQSVSNPKVFAVGDVADTPYALTPTGDMEGRIAASNIIDPGSNEADYQGIPKVVYTAPALCSVGMMEEEAEKKNISVKIIDNDISEWFSWKHMGQKFAGCKIIIDEKKEIILGAHVLGSGAEELANMFAMAIKFELPVSKLKKVLWAYPTKGYYFKYML